MEPAEQLNGPSFEWSEMDDQEEENQILLQDVEKNDLERGLKHRRPPPMSQDDAKRSPEQPFFHSKNKGFTEIACGCCVRDNDINKVEQRFYRKFVNVMITDYDQNNESHERNLAKLFKSAFRTEEVPGEPVESGLSMINERWMDIGF